MKNKRVFMYWLFAALLMTILFFGLKIITNFRFENSDDIAMVKAFMGFEGGQPANFSLYLHTLLAWSLYGLSLCAPSVAWLSYFQVALLFFSGVVLSKSFFQLAEKTRRPVLVGTLISVFFLTVFLAFISCFINFTTTASLAGTAAVVQMMTVDFRPSGKSARVRALLLALLLLAAGYCLRAYAVLPSLLFLGAVFLWRLIPQEGQARRVSVCWRTVLKTALLFTAVLVALFAVRQAEIGLRGLRGYMDWNDANGALLDYTDFETNAAPAVASGSGLSESEIKLVQQWYFMSSDIDEQALWTMAGAYGQTDANGWSVLWNFLTANRKYQYLTAVLVLLCALCLLKLRRKAWRTPVLSLGATAAAFVLLLYLASRGRLLSRAADSVILPCAALNLGFVLYRMKTPARRMALRITAIALSALIAAAAAGAVKTTYEALTRKPDYKSLQIEADLEAYALQNPKMLIVRTPNLLRDTRLFPDVSGGTPGNVLIWGDWLCRTPGWNRQLSIFGFDADHFTAADWLRETIVLAAPSQADTEDLCAYLTEETGQTVMAEAYGAYGTLYFYRFIPL